MDVSFRPVAPSDRAFVDRLARERWSELPLPELAALQQRAQRASYTAAWGPECEHIVVVGGDAAGTVWWSDDATTRRIIDVVLLDCCQRRGVGTAVFAALIAGAPGRQVGCSVAQADHRWHRRLLDLGFEEVHSDGVLVELARPAGIGVGSS